MSEQNFTSKVSFTRPANTNTYGAGDVVGATVAALEFPNLINGGGHVMITDVDFRIDLAAVTSGMGNFRLHLYNVTPPSAAAAPTATASAPWPSARVPSCTASSAAAPACTRCRPISRPTATAAPWPTSASMVATWARC